MSDARRRDAAAAAAAAGAGMAQALHAERVAFWKEQATFWLSQQRAGVLFTADDLVGSIGLPDAGPARNNVVGAWINAQSRLGRIEFTGRLGKSERVLGHGNLQRVWRLVDPPPAPSGFGQLSLLPTGGGSR